MKISTQIQYGVRALCDIAYNSAGSPSQVKAISERQAISARYIEQIFQKLRKAGIIRSIRGPAGGYFLSRRPEEITVADVIRAVEGKNINLVFCSGDRRTARKPCERLGKCVVSGIWAEASQRLMDYFESITLNHICEEAKKNGDGI